MEAQLISKTLGEGDNAKANRIFSMLVCLLVGIGIVLSTVCLIFLRSISIWIGAEGDVVDDCVTYGSILLLAMPAFLLQNAFQTFFVTADKPRLGLIITVVAGMTNIFLDCVLVVGLRLGLSAAAITTSIGQIIGGVVPLIYFTHRNGSTLRLTAPWFNGKALVKSLTNGLSEFVANASLSVVGLVYNFQLLKYIGNDGIAAYGVIMYVAFIFTGGFLGYSMGIMPIVGYNFGANHHRELRNLLHKSLVLISAGGVILTVTAIVSATPLAKIFVGYDIYLLAMTSNAFRLYSLSFLAIGFNQFGSAFFTGLNNGLISGWLSFSRTMIFELGCVLLLPVLFGINGIWLSIACAELTTLVLTVILLVAFKSKYHY